MIKQTIKKMLDVSHPFINPIYREYLVHHNNAIGVVFLMHRVGVRSNWKLPANELMKIDPAELERCIRNYKRVGVDFFSLDDLYETLVNGKPIRRPFVCFTFDDGYIDNYTTAYPIFKKYNIPFSIYITTDFPDQQCFLWWYHLEDYILSNDRIELYDGSTYDCKTLEQKNEAFLEIRLKVLSLPRKSFDVRYRELLGVPQLDTSVYVKTNGMSWNQIIELANDPLCTIGGHSITHPAFNTLSMKELKHEVEGGCKILESHIQFPVNHFAFPFGTSNEIEEREYDYITSLQFKTTVIVGGNTVNKDTRPICIPRITLK